MEHLIVMDNFSDATHTPRIPVCIQYFVFELFWIVKDEEKKNSQHEKFYVSR